ncbi:MAG: zinc ABC transporter substrate-binding protein [Desulfobulbaceae bacterium]|nr:zinc ABC transporter substrate-binding protein [Desulfobulbaceae bacterium]
MKFFSILAALLLLLAVHTGNAGADGTAQVPVFVSILPQAFFVEQVGGKRVAVDVLVQPGQSPATYGPTPKQMTKLAQSSVFFRIGVAFENVLIPKIQNSMPHLNIVDTRKGIRLERQSEVHDDDGHHHENELDPHIWLDPLLVKKQAAIIYNTLVQIDPEGEPDYKANFLSFSQALDDLNARLKKQLAPVKGKSFFVFHPAFGYFARAYGLQQIAVETGGKKPSGRHLAQLIESARRQGVHVLFVQPQFSQKSAQIIARAIDGTVVAIDPLARDYFANMEKMAQAVERSFR